MVGSGSVTEESVMRVLQALRQSSMDGYTLLSKIDLNEDMLVDALRKLGSIVSVKGELRKEKIGEAYLSIPPSARGEVDRMLGARLYRQSI